MTPRKASPASPKRPARAKTASSPAAKAKPATKRAPRRPRQPPAPKQITNVERVQADLDEMGTIATGSALAGAALTLAADLDNRKNSATSHAMCAKALLDVMAQLRDLAPPKSQNDRIDKIRDGRNRRLRAVK